MHLTGDLIALHLVFKTYNSLVINTKDDLGLAKTRPTLLFSKVQKLFNVKYELQTGILLNQY